MITSADPGQNNLNYSDTDLDESSHSVDTVIVGTHSCLDNYTIDSETSETSKTGISDDDYNVNEFRDSRIVSKVNDVAETLSIENSNDSDSSDVDEDGNSQNVGKCLYK